MMQGNLVRMVAGEHLEWSPRHLPREKTNERRLEQVRLQYVNTIAAKPPGEPQDGPWIVSPPFDSKRERRDSDFLKPRLKCARSFERRNCQLELGVIGVARD